MKRKMVYAGGSFTAGMFFASVFSPDMQIPVMLIMLLVSAFFFLKSGRPFVYFAVSAVFFVTGLLSYTVTDRCIYDRIRSFAGQEILFEGKITDIKDYAGEKSAYHVRGRINSGLKADIICYTSTLDCDYEDSISFRCTPERFENTFLFNTRDKHESEGCFLKTDKISDIKTEKNSRFSVRRLMNRYRAYTEKKISSILPDECGALISAMLLGDKSGLDESTKKELYRCGTGHMMAVSGMHLVLVVTFVSGILSRAGITGAKKFLASEAAVLLFVLFSGMSVSVIRAGLMVTLIYSAELFGRKTDALNSLCIASVLLLICSPYLIKNASFLLSVSGTYGTSVLAPYITAEISDENFSGRMKIRLISVFVISLCVFPFSVMFFDEASLVSPVSDIIIIPLCTFSLICGLGTAVFGAADVIAYPLLMAGGLASKLVFRISSFLSESGFSAVSLKRGYVPMITIILFMFVALTSLKYRKRLQTLTAMALSAGIFMLSSVVYGYMNRNILSVYHVGNSSASAVVLSADKCTDIIDLTGNPKSAQYAARLTDLCGMDNIESVSFLKNPYQSMASFSDRFVLNKVRHVYVPNGTYTVYGADICGCEPEVISENGLQLERNGYTVSASENGEVIIDYNGRKIICTASGVDTPEGIFSEQNIAVKCSDGGKIKAYKLD